MRVLIIEDNADDRRLISLRLPGIEVREAATLAEAQPELLREDWQPDVILLDLHLPDGEGKYGETWSAVRSLSVHAPVIVVSAQSLSDDPLLGRKAKEAGAASFTSKELILFSPENLLRQLDWATCEAGKTLAAAVVSPEASSSLADYNPNSVPAILSRLMQQQEQMHQENQTNAIQRKEQLDRIETQVKATNGRVTKNEAQIEELQVVNSDRGKATKTARRVAGLLLGAVLFLFGPSLKERAVIDNATVRRIADEQIALARKNDPHPAITNP